jgi:hypothetical protein
MPSIDTKKGRSSKLFTLSTIIFVSVSSLSYALMNIAGVNWPRYYPSLGETLSVTVPGQVDMGFDGRFLVSLLYGCIGIVIYLLISPIAQRFHLIKTSHAMLMMTTAFWSSLAIFILEEWHAWGIEVAGQESPGLFNNEFLLLFGSLLVLFFGILFNAGFEHRMTHIVKHLGKKHE